MAEENVSGARRKARADLIEQIDAAEDPERALLEYLIARVEKKDAELTKIIRYCAIPRRFDATVIGVLRQAPDESETNEGLLDRLLRFSFVRSRPDSGYAYDDSTRDILLEAWRDAEKRKEFDDLNARLVEFYEDQYEEAQRLERDLEQVAGLVRDACEERYVQLVSALERRILAPLLEAIYHGTLRSASSGYNQFARYFESWEAKDRLTICRSLLNATRTYFERLLPSSDQEPCLKWMDYWEARLQGGLRNHSEAEEILRKLLPQAEDDAKLKLWVWGSFAQTLHQRSKLREAREEYEGLLAFVETTHEDPYNLPWRHGGLANLYWSLGELSRAAEKYREAIRYAQEQRNFPMEAYTRLSLSGVLYEEGKWEEGIEAALQAFDFVRTECSTDRNLHFAVASRFMALLARRAPRLLDTIFVEATELLSGLAAPLRQLQLHNQYVNSLQDSGQLRRAEEALTDLKARASSSSDTAFAADLLLREGLLREGQGRLDEAIAVYTQLLQGSGKSQEIDWTYLAALSNRGMKWESLSRWPDAESDLREALAGWDKIGHRNLAAVMRVCLAEAARRQGQLAKSQELLDEALPSLIGLAPARLADYYEAQGDLFRTQAKRSEATTQYQQALAIRRSLDHFKDSAQILGRLAELAATLGQWERAEQYTAEANRLWQRLATVNRCQYTELAKQSDKENADGLCCFSEAGEDRREKLNQACNLFRSASEKVPDNFWYLLNLSYACAELEEWAEAAQAVEAILDRGPEWICSGSFLYERLIDYRLKHGALLIKAGRYEDAAQIYANSRARVESHVPLDELAGAWLKLGDYLLKLGLFKQARGEYLAVLACTTQIASAAVRADLHGRLGFLATVQVDARRSLSDSGTNFTKAIELYRAGDVSNPGEALGEACSTLLQSVGDYWTLESTWQILADEPGTDESLRKDLADARKSLAGYLGDLYQLSAQSGQSHGMLPVVTPIALEIAFDLIPEDDQEWIFLKTYVPKMRDRLQKEMGIRVPGVRVRGNETDLSSGTYIIMLDEVPLVSGTLEIGRYYCLAPIDTLQALGIAEYDLSPAPHPGTSAPGCWVAPEYETIIVEQGLELWADHQLYMLYHLDAVLRSNLADFVGVQEIANLVEVWAQEEDGAELVAEALPDDTARLRFGRVLRALLDEQVSIAPWREILEAVREVGLPHDDVHEAVKAVRLRLKPHLPGNGSDAKRVFVPEYLEEKISSWIPAQDDIGSANIPPEETQYLMNEIREFVQRYDQDLVLVARESEVRPFMRRLVQMEFPHIVVIAEEERLPPDELAVLHSQ